MAPASVEVAEKSTLPAANATNALEDRDTEETVRLPLLTPTAVATTSASTPTTVQVPAAVLNALSLSVDNLKKEMALMNGSTDVLKGNTDVLRTTMVSLQERNLELCQQVQDLQSQNTTIEKELRTVLSNSGGEFYLFRKLPREVQLMIWERTLNHPRVIALRMYISFSDGYTQLLPYSETRVPEPLKWICRASRQVAMKAQVSSLYNRVRPRWKDNLIPEFTLFINPRFDIMWLVDPQDDRSTWWKKSDLVEFINNLSTNHNEPQVVAFSPTHLLRFLQKDLEKLMDALLKIGTKEVVVVVSGAQVMRAPDVVFVQSKHDPRVTLSEKYLQWRRGVFIGGICSEYTDKDKYMTWREVEEETMSYLQREYEKAKRSESEESSFFYDYINGLTNIRFMEATTMTALKESGQLQTLLTLNRWKIQRATIPVLRLDKASEPRPSICHYTGDYSDWCDTGYSGYSDEEY